MKEKETSIDQDEIVAEGLIVAGKWSRHVTGRAVSASPTSGYRKRMVNLNRSKEIYGTRRS